MNYVGNECTFMSLVNRVHLVTWVNLTRTAQIAIKISFIGGLWVFWERLALGSVN
jgi:hypothetical protein